MLKTMFNRPGVRAFLLGIACLLGSAIAGQAAAQSFVGNSIVPEAGASAAFGGNNSGQTFTVPAGQTQLTRIRLRVGTFNPGVPATFKISLHEVTGTVLGAALYTSGDITTTAVRTIMTGSDGGILEDRFVVPNITVTPGQLYAYIVTVSDGTVRLGTNPNNPYANGRLLPSGVLTGSSNTDVGFQINFGGSVPPQVTSLSANSGPSAGGTSVVITGMNMSGATGVTFGGVAGTVTGNTATSVTVTSPAHVAGSNHVVVTTANGASDISSADLFTFADPAPVPTMTEWAMILFGTILAGGAALYIQRRRFTT